MSFDTIRSEVVNMSFDIIRSEIQGKITGP